MPQIITSENHLIKLWLSDIEEGAMQQARHLANLPFVFSHVALMPDAHSGFGMPIGGVLATRDVVIPNAVGVDIGCGMCAVRTSLTMVESSVLRKVMSGIRQRIPLGMESHKTRQDDAMMPLLQEFSPIVKSQFDKACYQLGTLGGGNHFIEIQRGSDGYIWIMIHSGSRNLGKTVAEHYNKLARKLNEQWQVSVPLSWDLAHLPVESEEAHHYINEMQFCVAYALANRKHMMHLVEDAMVDALGFEPGFGEVINIAHNYASLENHFGASVWVHRKGATRAYLGETGIIPGSQGTRSYIVEGLGNPDSFMSCSHGAGRVMGRRQAQRQLILEEEIRKLDEKGIIHGIRHTRDLDEAAGAYKNIDEVMANQADLVHIKVALEPMAVVKG